MKILGFDLASLFKAPKVTEEPVIPEPQEPDECESMHQMMYDRSAPEKCTVTRDYDQVTERDWQDFWMGGSENYQGGSEEIHK